MSNREPGSASRSSSHGRAATYRAGEERWPDMGSAVAGSRSLQVADVPDELRAPGIEPTTVTDLILPVATLTKSAVEHNVTMFADYCSRRGVLLAPHLKTTMSLQLAQLQLAAGAWGVTVANAVQARALAAGGISRLLIANQVVDPPSLAWMARIARDEGVEFLCYADSIEGVSRMALAWSAVMPGPRLKVFVELGYPGGRAGCRSAEDALAVARSVLQQNSLELVGVAGFEGVIGRGSIEQTREAVALFLTTMGDLALRLYHSGYFGEDGTILVTAGGSAHFDLVIEHFSALGNRVPAKLVLRSGCYAIHDHGVYERKSPLGEHAPSDGSRLRPALRVWGPILSCPEPGLVIAGIGRRNVGTDAGLPVPLTMHRDHAGPTTIEPAAASIDRLNDQHAYVRHNGAVDLRVGDILAFGISHPCTTLDKWRSLLVVDEGNRVLGAIPTSFW